MPEPTANPFAGAFTSWKTTIPAIIAGVIWLLRTLGIVEMPVEVEASINTLLLFLVGLFARDANKSSEGATVKPVE